MEFEGAVVQEQGVKFGIVVVQRHVLQNSQEESSMGRFGKQAFGPMPIVLMVQDHQGVPTYSGRPDIVRSLASTDFTRIPWKKFTTN